MTVWHDIDERVLLWVADDAPSSIDMMQTELPANDEPCEVVEGLSNRDVINALGRLESYGLIAFSESPHRGNAMALFTRPRLTGKGHQVLGDLPDFDAVTAIDNVRLVLDAMAAQASPQKASMFRRAVGIVGEIGGAIVVSQVEMEAAELGDDGERGP